jgi:hypothetical protein
MFAIRSYSICLVLDHVHLGVDHTNASFLKDLSSRLYPNSFFPSLVEHTLIIVYISSMKQLRCANICSSKDTIEGAVSGQDVHMFMHHNSLVLLSCQDFIQML